MPSGVHVKLLIIAILATFGSGCGDESDGYLSENNVCKADTEGLTDTVDASSEALDRMYGTAGSDARLAQTFTVDLATDLFWGIQLRLQADEKPSSGVDLSICQETAGSIIEGCYTKADGSTSASSIPKTTEWVSFEFSTPVSLSPAKYWIRLTPNYQHSENNRVGWAYIAGTGMSRYDLETEEWLAYSDRGARYRYIPCQ